LWPATLTAKVLQTRLIKNRTEMEKTESKNLIEGLLEEMNRVREIIKIYEEVGDAGKFAIAFMNLSIKKAEAAMATGDVVEMLRIYQELKEYEV
jgi:hypothetical protein